MQHSIMQDNKFKISSLNLCLGLKNKKFEVSQLLLNKQIDVICLQETEIDPHFNTNLLAIDGNVKTS